MSTFTMMEHEAIKVHDGIIPPIENSISLPLLMEDLSRDNPAYDVFWMLDARGVTNFGVGGSHALHEHRLLNRERNMLDVDLTFNDAGMWYKAAGIIYSIYTHCSVECRNQYNIELPCVDLFYLENAKFNYTLSSSFPVLDIDNIVRGKMILIDHLQMFFKNNPSIEKHQRDIEYIKQHYIHE